MLAAAAMVAAIGLTGACNGGAGDGDDDPDVVNTQAPDGDNEQNDNNQDDNDQDDGNDQDDNN
ncbi:hypothetical protein ACGF0J_20495 [Nonomuraea sp. NPDC047897]|uniref:hypothetical protein n=1 Tax=Nonomuraea sp. NPDC047897 TaxID=3364346 RepID=UPI0037220E8F